MDEAELKRLEDLEILVAHQSHMLDDLNDVVISQDKTILELRRKFDFLTNRFEDLQSGTEAPAADQKPPHW